MSDAKQRARQLLEELPLTDRQRALYQRGADALDDARAEEAAESLEAALNGAERAVDAMRGILERRRTGSRRKVLVAIQDDDYRRRLQEVLGSDFDVQLLTEPAEALAGVEGSPPDVVISDLQLPATTGLQLLERMRRFNRLTTGFIRTTTDEEVGQAAAHRVAAYPAAGTAEGLRRAVLSALDETEQLLP
ncbi:MAG: response regulator [Acidimicrobiia bacterium]|nr:response regulator [Acidimicrobiia bacterium]